ncbi:(2Fe-2S)-binding protein [Yoonia sp. 2307UL14-13]|uniref:(2Fe-2S)-binding protein n=1 Tax=Yoonia sp. 2307UL14-13 TaxID=3126506 RepID=UPI0030A23D2F
MRQTWQDLAVALPRLDDDFSPVIQFQPAPDFAALNDIPEAALPRWMADAAIDVEGPDAKLRAAYLMGDLSFAVVQTFAALALRGYWVVASHASPVGVRPRFVHWTEDGENGVSQTFDLFLNPDSLVFSHAPSPYAFARTIEDLFSPIVKAMTHQSKLSNTAFHRLIGDSIAYAFLAHGRVLDREQEAMVAALSILREPGTKLTNRKVRFDHITLPEAPEIGQWLRVRGGCCRAYTRPGKPDYCTTCVLRDDESRAERFRNYLRRTRLRADAEKS